jgi:hypothetical protein
MVEAQRVGEPDTYLPLLNDRTLALECHDVEATLANLRDLTDISSKKLQRRVVSIYAIDGRILIVFDTGETYLATGFSLGSNERETTELALFAARQKLDEKGECLAVCRSLPANFTGPVLPHPRFDSLKSAADAESGVISTGDTQTLPVAR